VDHRPDTWRDPSPHSSHLATVNGVRLHYLDWGGADAPLVLIPGFGDTPHCFDDLAPALRDRCRVVGYARRGHGRSQAKSPYDYQPVRNAAIERLRKELADLTILELNAGNHNNFFLAQRTEVVAAMRAFLAR